ncbi:hypothetical protein O181_034600 [Austropuccinia psidii MF-1]|uniref:Uncharacterized protein n=1 Tax=Austropuccinia psidii MF-1 TaxID=1389203 RepID=A0A9Q3D5A7_9BASI|nr:hypothetical protein [Austropuccinia psidii MF-1]
MYGIDFHNNKDRYFTIGYNKHQKFAFLPFKRHITENELSSLLYDHREAFASDKEPLGEIIGHEVDIILNIERPYPPLLKRSAYPASLKSREALEIYIKELLDLGVIRKVGHNEEVEITTPVIVASEHLYCSRQVPKTQNSNCPYADISSSVYKHYGCP